MKRFLFLQIFIIVIILLPIGCYSNYVLLNDNELIDMPLFNENIDPGSTEVSEEEEWQVAYAVFLQDFFVSVDNDDEPYF